MRTVIVYAAAIIWLYHLVVGAGAGWAAIRLWSTRHHSLGWRLGLFLTGYVVEVLSAVALLFVARGVRFTLTFTAVLFGLTAVADTLRVLLIIHLIKGPAPLPSKDPESGALPPQFWLDAFRTIVREELNASKLEAN